MRTRYRFYLLVAGVAAMTTGVNAMAAESFETLATSASKPVALGTGPVAVMNDGTVSLRELAEEELLLALPAIASCNTPESCGQAPAPEERQRPFAVLQDLLKKT